MECSGTSFESRLSDWLGVPTDRARRVVEGCIRWNTGQLSDIFRWDAKVGQHIHFTGGLALDRRGKEQVTRLIFDRVGLLVGVADDDLCGLENGDLLPAKMVLADLRKWTSPNGIACPSCGADLLDKSPGSVLYSDPPQTSTHCVDCGHQGYRDLEPAFSTMYPMMPDE